MVEVGVKMDGTGMNGENVRDETVIGKQMSSGSVLKGTGMNRTDVRNTMGTANHGHDDGRDNGMDTGKNFMDDGANNENSGVVNVCSRVESRFVPRDTIHKLRLRTPVLNSVCVKG